MKLTARILFLVAFLLSPLNAFAENEKPGTYFKFGLVHWQKNIFSESLTRWEGNLFGTDYDLTSASAEIETYFKNNHLLLSGWSIGYRKDAIRYINSGHMFSGKVFRNFDLKVIELKVGGGGEWGSPSLVFDKTRFDLRKDGSLHYRHTYPKKNTNIPFRGTAKDGALYPFAELSAVERVGPFLFEGGMRVNVIRFGIDDYEVVNNKLRTDLKDREMLVPYLFANFGIRMWR